MKKIFNLFNKNTKNQQEDLSSMVKLEDHLQDHPPTNKQSESQSQARADADNLSQADELDLVDDNNGEVGIGTKVKVIAALIVVAVATYVAYWVQEPTTLKVNVFDEGRQAAEDTTPPKEEETLQDIIAETSLTAQADTDLNLNVQEVTIADFSFTPANMTVETDTTVLWSNMDSVAHTVTAEDFSSGSLEPGDSYAYTFDKEGVYEYTCSFHPQMKGKITVVASASEEVFGDDASFEETEAADTAAPTDVLTPSETSPANTVEVTPTLLSFDEDVFDRDEIKPAAAAESDDVPTLEPIILAPVAAAEAASDATPTETPQEVLKNPDEDTKLAKSGPEDTIYVFALIAIAYFNRKRLFKNNH